MSRRVSVQIIASMALTFVLIITMPTQVLAESLETSAISAILIDAASGDILSEKNPHEKREPASITKIMTMLLALEAVEAGMLRLDEKVIVSENAHSHVHTDGSVVFLEMGEKRTVEELLIGIAVGSGNDACVALAERIGGSENQFVNLMNQRAKELGMHNTRLVNPHGMPAPDHYTTAYDIALMCAEATKYPQLLQYTSIYEYQYRADPLLILWNTNKLLAWYEGVVDGLKTGWTEKAGYCLAATGERDGFRLISVVLGCPVPRSHFQEAIKFLNYGFARYTALSIADKGEVKASLPVLRGVQQELNLLCDRPLSVSVLKGEESTVSWELNLGSDQVLAPVAQGTKLGKIIVKRDGRLVTEVDLIAEKDIERLNVGGLLVRVFNSWLSGGTK